MENKFQAGMKMSQAKAAMELQEQQDKSARELKDLTDKAATDMRKTQKRHKDEVEGLIDEQE